MGKTVAQCIGKALLLVLLTVLSLAWSMLCQMNLKYSFISIVRRTVHTNPSRNLSFLEILFKPEEFENASFAFS